MKHKKVTFVHSVEKKTFFRHKIFFHVIDKEIKKQFMAITVRASLKIYAIMRHKSSIKKRKRS